MVVVVVVKRRGTDMEKKTLEVLFTNKVFCIPDYQRDYAWESDNVDDLFSDVRESIETGTGHYVGTFILSKVNSTHGEIVISEALQIGRDTITSPDDAARKAAVSNLHSIVDGQQRLITLSMILHALVAELSPDDEDRVFYERRFLRSRTIPHLILQNTNQTFYYRLFQDTNGTEPKTRGQRRLMEAYKEVKRQVQTICSNGKPDQQIRLWLDAIKDLAVLEFIEEDEGRAIRIFQTVNDRGVPLTMMDKAKSLLVYYSSRFLNSELDHTINESFGEAYRSYDAIKEVAESPAYPIGLIKARKFDEDSILRWQFVSMKSNKFTYEAPNQYLLDSFLRPELKDRRDNTDNLKQFIKDYVFDVRDFFSSLHSILDRMKTDAWYYRFFALLGPSTYLYPLIVRLGQRELLNEDPFRQLIEIADVRVYKTRATDPSKDITMLARDVVFEAQANIAARLRTFIDNFMPNAEFEKRLRQDVYSNQALVHILFEFDQHLLKRHYTLAELKERRTAEPTIEHVFAQQPRFDFPAHGFQSRDEYQDRNNKFGNLLVLEKRLNGRCNNRTMEEKINENNLYAESAYECVHRFRLDCKAKGEFTVTALDGRTDELVQFCLTQWPL